MFFVGQDQMQSVLILIKENRFMKMKEKAEKKQKEY